MRLEDADPLGLLALQTSTVWRGSSTLGTGGLTTATVDYVKCWCSGCGDTWKISGCSAVLNIDVQLLTTITDPEERDFYRRSEQQHVDDYVNSLNDFQHVGSYVEQIGNFGYPGGTFPTKGICEARATRWMTLALRAERNIIQERSRAKWDHGLHSYDRMWRTIRKIVEHL